MNWKARRGDTKKRRNVRSEWMAEQNGKKVRRMLLELEQMAKNRNMLSANVSSSS